VRFVVKPDHTGADASGGLTPCFNSEWLSRIGVNLQAFPALATSKDDCLDIPATIPGATLTYHFASQRLDVNIPQAAMHNSARGYIPPEEWDEGITAALLNYNFTGSRGTDSDNYF
jgi:outer membrane usher protein